MVNDGLITFSRACGISIAINVPKEALLMGLTVSFVWESGGGRGGRELKNALTVYYHHWGTSAYGKLYSMCNMSRVIWV